jgi:hypothetical protein
LLASYSIYADDVVRVTRHMAVDGGLRWEITQLTSHASAAQASRPAVYRHSYMNISPRLGMAYLVNDTPRWETNLRLGSGVFYDTNDGSVLGLLSDPPFATRTIYADMPFPLTARQLDLSGNDAAGAVDVAYPDAFGPGANLRSPVTYSWSLAVDQTVGGSNKLVASYVGNEARHLHGRGVISLPAPSDLSRLRYEVPGLNSSYEALQVQFQHRTSGNLQVFAAYTWAHALDSAPTYRGGTEPYALSRANSDADRRHVARVGGTYTLPRIAWGWRARSLLNGWSTALNIAIQSGNPFSVTNRSTLLVLPDGQQTLGLANTDSGAAAWVHNAAAPGGWQLNAAAFSQTTAGVLGNSGRNTFRGFSVGQADIAITREYAVNERIRLHIRAEVFNLTNHPSFSNFSSTWGPQAGIPTFGQAQTTLGKSLGDLNPLYQIGGPRNVQLAVRFTF